MARLLPLRWTGEPPPGDLSPLNCILDGPSTAALPAVTPDQLAGLHVIRNAPWPSVRVTSRGNAEAGPTGAPWVNANGWRIRRARHLHPSKPVWVDARPPAVTQPAEHVLAVAEAMAYGATPVVTYQTAAWAEVRKALGFFLAPSPWLDWPPVAALGVAGSFAGARELFEGEYLNLLARRQVGYSLLNTDQLVLPSGLKALVWLPSAPPPRAIVDPWVRRGGLLIYPAKPWTDPYAAAVETHLAMSRRLDVLRMWNSGAVNSHYQASVDGTRGIVHLVNYAVRRASHDVSVWLSRPWKNATWVTFDERKPLNVRPANAGIEVALPPLGAYAAIELEA